MNIFKVFLIGIVTAVLSACGGGSSSSGGNEAPPPPPVDISGTYEGTLTATFSAPGVASETDNVFIRVIIDGNNVQVTDGDFTASGSLSNTNGYNATTGANGYAFTDGSISCSGELTFSGTADGETSNGNSLGLLRCSQGSASVEITTEGPYTTTKTSTAAAKVGSGSLINAVNRIFANQQ